MHTGVLDYSNRSETKEKTRDHEQAIFLLALD